MSDFETHSTTGLSNSGVPNPSCGGTISADIWFEVVAPASGDMDIATLAGTMTDAAMAIYEGPCTNLTEIDCTQDDNCGNTVMPILQFDNLTPGTSYFIRIWPENGSPTGDFEIRVTDGDPTAPPLTLNPIEDAFATGGGCIQLTTETTGQTGCAWDPVLVDFSQPFTNTVLLNFGDINGGGADGITMTYHDDPAGMNTCGPSGGSLAAEGIQNSFIIEFDTWDNGPGLGDIPQDHVSVDVNGNLNNPINGPTSLGNIEDGLDHEVHFSWDPVTMTYEIYFDGNLVMSGVYDIITNAFNGQTMVYCGFTASTGGAINNQTVCPPQPEIFPAGSESETDVEICLGDCHFAGGACQTNAGTYTDIFVAANGCDSILHTTISVLPTSTTTLSETICDGDCVTVGNQTFCTGGNYQVVLTNYLDCDSTVNLDLTVLDPVATIHGNSIIDCNNPTTMLDGSPSTPAGVTYNWTTADGNIVGPTNGATIIVDGAGTYQLEVSYTQNGTTCNDIATFTVSGDFTPPNVDAGPPPQLDCNNSSTVTLNGSVTGTNNFTVNWTTNDGNIVSGGTTLNPTVDEPGTYTIVVTNSDNGCTGEDSVTVTEDTTPPIIVILPPDEVTCETTLVTIDATGSSTGPNFTFNWVGPGIFSGANTLTPTVNSGGSYTLVIANTTNGCTASETVTVPEDTTPPPAMVAAAPQLDCIATEITIDGTGSGNATSTFTWSGPGIISGGNTLTPTVNQPGTYTIVVTDSDNGCTNDASVTVTQDIIPPLVNAGSDAVLDCNNPNQITLSGTGSSSGPGFTINWTTNDGNIVSGGNTLTPTVDEPGTYTLNIVNNNNGCSADDEVVVTEDMEPPVVIAVGNGEVTCYTPLVTISGNGSSTGPNFFINWSGPGIFSGQNGLNPTVNAGGTYTLTITNIINGCSGEAMVDIDENTDTPTADILSPNQIDCTNPVIALDATGSGGNPPVIINWTTLGGNFVNGQNTLNPTVDAPGTYILVMENTDSGCTAEASVTVNEDTTIPTASAGGDIVLDCVNSLPVLNGGASSTGTGIMYQWTTPDGNIVSGANTLNPTVDAGGTYTLLVSNSNNGCTAEDEMIVTEDNIPPDIEIVDPEYLDCYASNGQMMLDGSGSEYSSIYTIFWTTIGGNFVSGENTFTPIIDAPGFYTLFIINPLSGCSSNLTVTVDGDTDPPIADIVPPAMLNCDNEILILDGTNSSSPSGTFTFNWTTPDGNISAGANSLTPEIDLIGTYILTITNSANGCTDEASVDVSEDIVNPLAEAGDDETIGCAQPNIQLNGAGSSTGNQYSYIWTDENDNTVATNTLTPTVGTAGTYTIVVTNDQNGCTAQDQVTINQDMDLPQISVAPVEDITCVDLTVLLDATDSDSGTDFSFEWQTSNGSFESGENTLAPTVNSGGTYTLTITNLLSDCSSSQNIIVTEDNLNPDLSLLNPDLLNCANAQVDLEGTTTVNVNDLDILWTTTNGNITGDTTSLSSSTDSPGDYELTITNLINGCQTTENITVEENLDVPIVEAGEDAILNCDVAFIELDGSASSSGNPYTYLWQDENGDTLATNTLTPTVEFPGTYTLQIINSISTCEAVDTIVIAEDVNAPNIEIAQADTLTCASTAFALDASNSDSGTGFQISWQTLDGNIISGANSLTPQIDSAGTYELTILNTDNNCESIEQITVNQDVENPLAEILFPDTLNCEVTALFLDGQGSTSNAEFSYSWTTPNGNISSSTDSLAVEVDAPGDYILNLVNTFNGCTAEASVNVAQDIEDPIASAGGDLTILCTIPSVTLDGSGSSIGNQFEYIWTDENDVVVANEQNPDLAISGDFTLTVINTINGCSSQDQMTVNQDDNVPNIEIAPAQVLTCATQSITIDGSNSDSGTGITTSWQTADGNIVSGSDELTPTIDQIGTYTLTIFNSNNGCSATENVVIAEDLAPPVPQIAFPDTLTCTTESVLLDAAASGPPADFQISWQTIGGNIVSGNQSLNPEIDAPGVYILNLVNVSNGCAEDVEIEVIEDIESPVAEAGTASILTCETTNLELAGSGVANAPISYLWNTVDGELISGVDTPNPSIGAPGTYTLMITNLVNGCTETDAIQVNQDITTPPIVIATPDLLSCVDTILNLDATGSASGMDYMIEWTTTDGNILSGNQTLNPEINAIGSYVLSITDTQNGCTNEQTIAVQEDISILTVDTDVPQLLTCETLDINLSAQGVGGSNLTYEWNTIDGSITNGQNTETPNINSPGTYGVLVTDMNNGCTAEAEVLVSQDITPPQADAGADDSVSCIDPEATLDGSLSSTGTNYTYQWTTTGGNILSGGNTLNPVVDEGGDYTLLVTNLDNGCTAEASTMVEWLIDLPQVAIASPDTLTCNILSIDLSASVTGVDLSLYSIEWIGGEVQSGGNTLNPTIGASGTYTLTVANLQSDDCTVIETIEVPADVEAPQPDIATAGLLTCEILTLDLDATNSSSPENFTILWTTTDGNITTGVNSLNPQIDEPGTYTLTLINEENACSASQNILIEQDITDPYVEANVEGQLNCKEQQITLDGMNSSQGSQYSYNWTTSNGNIVSGQSSLTPIVAGPGTYTLEVMDNDNGCDDSDDVDVTQDIQDPVAVAGDPAEINCETGEAELNGSATSSSPNIEYQWSSNNGTIVSGQNGTNPIVNGIGNYTLVVTNLDNGCTDEATVPVIENLPIGELDPREPPCVDELGAITVTAVSQGTPPYEYSFDGGASFSANNIADNIPPGAYSVIVKDAKGCEYAEDIFIAEGLDPQIVVETEVELQLGDIYQINANVNFPQSEIETIQWTPSTGLSCDDCLNPQINPTQNVQYILTIRTEDGCETTEVININVRKETKIYIPNAFSPNGDGINDVFMIFADQKNISKINSFLGFSRWGESVFEFYDFQPNDPDFGWDGKYRNEKMNAAVFVWFAEIEFIDGTTELFEGDVILVR